MNPQSKLDEYLDLMRDAYHHSVYKCRECGFRAFGRPVTVHEMQLNHIMIKEEPNELQTP